MSMMAWTEEMMKAENEYRRQQFRRMAQRPHFDLTGSRHRAGRWWERLRSSWHRSD